jgi:flagellar assembly protein FliH
LTSSKIIRPRGGTTASETSLEFNLEDIERLGRHLIRDAREKVQQAEEEKAKLEEEMAHWRKSLEEERGRRLSELDDELRDIRESIPVEAEKTRAEAFESGRADGHEQGKTEGYKVGFEEGNEKGRQEGYTEAREEELGRIKQETDAAVSTLRSINEHLQRKRTELVGSAKEELVHLACRIAEKILKRQIELDPEVVIKNVEKAIELVFQCSKVVIQVHEEDLALVEKYSRESRDLLAEFRDFEISAVKGIQRGGCRVVSGTGQVDLSIETQLQVIEEKIRAVGDSESDCPDDLEAYEDQRVSGIPEVTS